MCNPQSLNIDGQCISAISLLSTLARGRGPSFEQIESYLPMAGLCLVS